MWFFKKRKPAFLIIPPSPRFPGSGGDEAIVLSAMDLLKMKGGAAEIHLAAAEPAHPGWHFAAAEKIRLIRLASLNAATLRKYQRVYWFGADTADGAFGVQGALDRCAYLNAAAAAGVPAKLTNFSFREKVEAPILQQMRRFYEQGVSLSLRDKLSLDRFSKAVGVPADFAADIAFLLKPGPVPVNILRWIENHKKQGRKVVGINPHGFAPALLAGLINASTQTAFIFIPHDNRKNYDEAGLIKTLCGRLTLNPDYFLALEFLNARALRGLCAHLDMVITGRMHLAVAAFSQWVPPVGREYNAKFRGLYQLFGAEELLLLNENPNALQDLMSKVLTDAGFKIKIAARLDEVKASALNHLDLP